MSAQRIDLPDSLGVLFEPSRYKVVYGGRGSGKSWSVARALLVIAASRPTRILCGREFQRSMKDSVHKLLADQIDMLGLGTRFTVTSTSIVSTCGSEFIFTGLRHNAEALKSLEGVDIAWVEQAERLSKTSLDILVPTVRKEGSEIWFTLNPELEEDEVYKRFVVGRPANAIVIEQNWRDNPWFTSVLKSEMEEMRRRDPDGWLNVYEGKPLHALQGAIYANELRKAAEDGRITKIPVVGGTPVHTAWDLGHSDNTAIWFFQRVGFEYRMVDFFSDNAQKLDHYLRTLQQRGYVYGRHYLPHDAESNRLEGKSVANQVRDVYGRSNVIVVPRTDSVVGDLNICRTVFDQVWFDQERCADGLHAMRHYRYAVDPDTGRTSRNPLHDWTSDTADAFRTFAVGFKQDRRVVDGPRPPPIQMGASPGSSWLGV